MSEAIDRMLAEARARLVEKLSQFPPPRFFEDGLFLLDGERLVEAKVMDRDGRVWCRAIPCPRRRGERNV